MTVYLNGRFVPREEACVPVLDRGFLFGDGVYEVIPVYTGHLFRLDAHLRRLDRSLAAVRIENPHDHAGWGGLLDTLVSRNGGGDLAVYLQVTRGVAPRDHAFPADARPTVFAMANPLAGLAEPVRREGAAAVSRPDYRWGRCDIKAITLLPNVLLRQEAVDAGAMETILLRDGHAVEGAASNLFAVFHGQLHTPPNGPSILPGITREVVWELAGEIGLDRIEAPIPETALREADEIILTSSTKELVPVTRLDGTAVGSGRPGPVYRRLHEAFQALKERIRQSGRPA